ncbi:TlpA family protein disulfide reductase [Neolewinella persica]|uniref:TlpA family protein disulfide reductase n=1 Tax=Neolewinella persica TaxID=70998 RepID=UPI0003657ABB|nr:hypothetical protein [Neolewinella persica]
MQNPRSIFYFFALLVAFSCGVTSCASDFFADGRTRVIPLTDAIRNISGGYYQEYWELEDTAKWEAVYAKMDTLVTGKNGELPGDKIKFRSERIWYEVKHVNGGLRSRQHYPGWVRRMDSISRDLNIMLIDNYRRVRVNIPAADVVLGGDSLRIALIHTEGPAFDWDFFEYKPVPDRLLLTTYGNDTLPIMTDMACVGEISRQTVFRVGKQYYAINFIADDYGSLEIELLEDARGLPLTAEIDLSYKAVPVEDLDGNATTIKRTPGRELILYFWGGFDGEKQLRGLDSLYQALPAASREEIDVAVISRFRGVENLKAIAERLGFQLPLYRAADKTCLRLNCSTYLPYFVTVNARGRVTSFHDWVGALEKRLIEMGE